MTKDFAEGRTNLADLSSCRSFAAHRRRGVNRSLRIDITTSIACAEVGLIAAQGARRASELIEQVRSADPSVVPDLARSVLLTLADQLGGLAAQINALERRLLLWDRQDQASQPLATIPGVGINTTTALAASVPDPSLFRSGREFSALLGLVPRQTNGYIYDQLGRYITTGVKLTV